MTYDNLRLDVADPVATLTLDRQPGNRISIDMLEQMTGALLSLRGRRMLEVLVIRGAGGTFCEGLELEELDRSRVQRLMQVYARTFETLRMLEVITVAAVDGRAWGAGFALTLDCDLAIASTSASFKLNEIDYGVFPPIASILLPRVVGRRRAMEWILSGCEVSSTEAERHNVVNHVFAAEAFDAGVSAFVANITRASGPVLQLAKRAQYEAYDKSYDDGLARVRSLYLKELMGLRDAQEGLEAGREGRDPEWLNE
jgi:enoyl-CoA hydratase/carnithine racemase